MHPCPHCEGVYKDARQLDGHLAMYHPHTVEARCAAERLLSGAKGRGQREASPSPAPVLSPKRSEGATAQFQYAERRRMLQDIALRAEADTDASPTDGLTSAVLKELLAKKAARGAPTIPTPPPPPPPP
eukprot:Sspe_Gene.62352::Locus_34957_Transcript_3_3_Confidence_0.714_Length_4610::g.62352::m.62352